MQNVFPFYELDNKVIITMSCHDLLMAEDNVVHQEKTFLTTDFEHWARNQKRAPTNQVALNDGHPVGGESACLV